MRIRLAFTFILLTGFSYPNRVSGQEAQRPKISFSFDDGSISNFPGYPLAQWNQLLLDHLDKHGVQAIFFVKGQTLDNAEGKQIIRHWNEAGHLIGNHTYTHPFFHSETVSLEQFKGELLKNDSLISGYTHYTKRFRFPYLKEGNTPEKRDGFRAFLIKQGYKIGHVTIDASDWYIAGRLVNRLKDTRPANLSAYKQFYIEHLYDRALFYDSLAVALTGRHISHTLLLHHNLAAALFLDDLIQHFKDQGWEIVDAGTAYEDEIYTRIPNTLPAGESLIWALAKASGRFDAVLRYPAEDGKYEKDKMDILGL